MPLSIRLVLEVEGTSGLVVTAASVAEQLSAPFRVRVEVESDADLDGLALLRKTAALKLNMPTGADRAFHGRVVRVARRRSAESDSRFRFTIELAPSWWFLQLRRNCRIFQEKDVLEIFEVIAGEHQLGDVDKSFVRQSLAKLEYCVQYQESDLAFLSRLLEEHGIFYYFRHDGGVDRMVLGDCAAAFDDCSTEALELAPQSVPRAKLDEWDRDFSYVPGKVAVRDWDWMAPDAVAEGSADTVLALTDAAQHESYEYPGRVQASAAATASAESRMHALEVGATGVDATGDVPVLQPGGKFPLDEHFDADSVSTDGSFLVLSCEHEIGDHYRVSFRCVPVASGFSPPRTTPRPRIAGVQTAKVTGPSGEELHTDEHGRVKVQFHWDRDGANDENTTCFLRVAQPWSGAGYGAWFLPRIGSEVVVTFIDGDPDRPLVTGCIYHPGLAPPWTPGDTPNVSGFKTRSTPDGAADTFSELRFDDTKDAELVVLQAQRDRQLIVKHDDTVTITGKRTTTIEEGDETLTVAKGARAVTISEGDETLTVSKGACTFVVSEGDHVTTVGQGKRTAKIDQGNDEVTVTQGNLVATVSAGKCTIEAGQEIELKVGGNSIKIETAGITVKGMKISIQGDVKAEVKAPMLDLTSDGIATLKGCLTKIG